LLLHETVNALRAAGLDTSIGCLHDLCYQRHSLGCDVLELLRPWSDAWVFALFRRHVLRLEDFSISESACVMQAAGKQRFYQTWRHQAEVFRRLLRSYATQAARVVDCYEPS